jgi:hypothetical protein
MEEAENLELEILLTLRSNKTVQTRKFHELFEQDWNLYRSKFNELIIKKFLNISVQIPGICVFELSKKGDERIDELLHERDRETESTTFRIRNFLNRFNRISSEFGSYVSNGINTFHL